MDYAAAAETIAEVAELLIDRAGVEPGMEVLDVGCGTGNAAIPAARAGARVTGLDPSPDLLAIARERAADAMVEVEWVEGSPRELPFEDGSFDRVISIFSAAHDAVAGELRRVCRGRIGICRWTAGSTMGRMLGMIADPGWGTEARIRELVGDGVFERRDLEWRAASAGRFADFMLESVGCWDDELRERFVGSLNEANLADDGTLLFRSEYLLAVVDC